MPESLKTFSDDAQKSIIQWFEAAKANTVYHEKEEEDKDDYDLDQILLIIEWNQAGIIQRNISKNHIVNAMLK